MSRLTTVNSNYFETANLNGTVVLSDYKNDTELIAFTSLDFEDFYEAKWAFT